jgi:hypothetical protein
MPSDRSLRSTAFALLIATTLLVPAAHAQDSLSTVPPQPPWTLSGLFEVIRVNPDSWGIGPALGIRRDFGHRLGIELRAALPAFNGSGGAAIDLAATYTYIKRAAEFGASLGGSGFLVGDQSELTGGGVGLYAAVHASRWLSRGFGITGGINFRTAIGSYTGGYAGVAFRF